ncbi:MAG: HaeIII family restriction endonuclease [Lachnospiraceae bacterium]|nr:HaeIII family restriction endonuclease [Lachnospiraceae bacterium]
MANGIQTSNGKAFEYACVIALNGSLSEYGKTEIVSSPQLETAKGLYENIEPKMKGSLDKAARAAVRVVKRLEPQLWNPEDNEPLYLSIQPDSAGIKGDVRDVLCVRKQNGWEIGFSCKHNHHAVKHSRLSDTIDFGKEWLGIPCSKEYFNTVVPLFEKLRSFRDSSKCAGKPMLWEKIPDKAEKYYKPILEAFMKELKRIADENKDIPAALIHYLLGRNDFYKVITEDSNRTTRIEAINISGTLNTNAGKEKSIAKVPILKMPTQFYHIGFKANSDNTVEVVCDEGWQISMRIHNASSKVEPSLKFDVQLISFPSSVFAQVEPWESEEDRRILRLNSYATGLNHLK